MGTAAEEELAETGDGTDGGSNSNGHETGSASQTGGSADEGDPGGDDGRGGLSGVGDPGGDGDGDGDSDPGDGDGDSDPGDGDGDSDPGDGDSDPGDGDGDGLEGNGDGGGLEGDGDGDGGGLEGDGDGDGDGGGLEGNGDGDGDGDGSDIENIIPQECAEAYHVLTLADRSADWNDGDGNVERCDRLGSGKVDPQWHGLGWYRLMGDAGTRLPEDPPELHSCGTEKPGWMVGDHPSVEDGKVARMTCFSWANDSCQWNAQIEVINCGNFYLYHLPDTSTCALRYCGID